MSKHVLNDFQEYLRSNSLVQEKYIPFYAHWARSFLRFNGSNGQCYIALWLIDKRIVPRQANSDKWQ
jgi:hypothetical protein